MLLLPLRPSAMPQMWHSKACPQNCYERRIIPRLTVSLVADLGVLVMEALEMAQDKAVEPMDAMDEALASPSVNFPATASL